MPGDKKEAYVNAKTWPKDAIEVDGKTYINFTQAPPTGKVLGSSKDGLPEWVQAPALTDEEISVYLAEEKKRRIDEANYIINSKQWPGKAALGRLKGDDLEQYNIWLDYLDALDAVDTSSGLDVDWPEQPSIS